MALIKCPECGTEIDNENKTCPNCGCPIDKKAVFTDVKKRFVSHRRRLLIFMLFLFIGAGINLYSGFNVKDNYTYENKYVGGDAYNYIINASYFTGYMVLGSAQLLGGIICACATIPFTIKIGEVE